MSTRPWFLRRYDFAELPRVYCAMMVGLGLTFLAMGVFSLQQRACLLRQDAERIEFYAAALVENDTPGRVVAGPLATAADAIRRQADDYWLTGFNFAFGGWWMSYGLCAWIARSQAERRAA